MQIKHRDPNNLIAAEYNPRKLSSEQFEQIKSSIQRFGFVDPVIVNVHPDRKDIIVGGHQRVKVARNIGVESVPTVEVNLDEARERELNVRLNKNTGEFDFDILKQQFDVPELLEWGFTADEIEWGDEPENPDIDAEPQLSAGEELAEKWGVREGQLWGLGEHLLLCGDCAKPDNVSFLMKAQLADMMITDPPYGVSYVGKTKDALKVENDELNPDELTASVELWFNGAEAACRKGAYWIATVPPGPLHLIFAQDFLNRGVLRQIMVWIKDSMVLGHSEYHYRHEPILFGWVPGGDRLKNADRKKTTVWEFDRPKASREHPTMKPVEMWAYGIKQHTQSGDIVYEPFSGSGTTIIACEQLSRKCRAIEISPAYVAVAIQRWVDATNGEPTILEVMQ